jgi:U3 small nucleolar RNA-associated protein 12
MQFFLSLYGHKLPVMDMDISTDNSMIITASADKNVKIWGLDFGDCHKSLFAHGDSVMAVKFVPNTHYFFTGGKDNVIKYWDADKFEQILSLEGHWGEVWSVAVSSLGDFVVTGSHDRSIRLWERTEEQVKRVHLSLCFYFFIHSSMLCYFICDEE